MATRFTVSPLESGGFGVFDDGEFLEAPTTGTWGAAKKIADRLNDEIRTVRMKYEPMLAKDSKIFQNGPGWFVERKWDGMRAIFEIQDGETYVFSRTGQDLRPQFPELCRLHEILPPCILDGEIIAVVEKASPEMLSQLSTPPDSEENLELLQWRISDKKAMHVHTIPVGVKFFDILEVNGRDVRDEHLFIRRNVLLDTVGADFVTEILPAGQDIPDHWEGVISKQATSRYESGKRRAAWSKYKFVHRATLWAVELTPGIGARSSSFGAIVVQDEKGVVRGQVGSGFTAAQLQEVMDLMEQGWFLIEVEYRFLSKTGLMVNTAYKGVRSDKKEADVL